MNDPKWLSDWRQSDEMQGRAPIPNALKLARAIPVRKQFRDEPVVESGVPACPQWVTGYAEQFWHRTTDALASMGIASPVDASSLEEACKLYALIREADDAIAREGAYQKSITQHGEEIIRPHPGLRVRLDADTKLRHWLVEFGLTPSSRSRINSSLFRAPEPASPASGYFR
jgi:P27 family predicted phage terminase small subunit